MCSQALEKRFASRSRTMQVDVSKGPAEEMKQLGLGGGAAEGLYFGPVEGP